MNSTRVSRWLKRHARTRPRRKSHSAADEIVFGPAYKPRNNRLSQRYEKHPAR